MKGVQGRGKIFSTRTKAVLSKGSSETRAYGIAAEQKLHFSAFLSGFDFSISNAAMSCTKRTNPSTVCTITLVNKNMKNPELVRLQVDNFWFIHLLCSPFHFFGRRKRIGGCTSQLHIFVSIGRSISNIDMCAASVHGLYTGIVAVGSSIVPNH